MKVERKIYIVGSFVPLQKKTRLKIIQSPALTKMLLNTSK